MEVILEHGVRKKTLFFFLLFLFPFPGARFFDQLYISYSKPENQWVGARLRPPPFFFFPFPPPPPPLLGEIIGFLSRVPQKDEATLRSGKTFPFFFPLFSGLLGAGLGVLFL